MRNDKDKWDEPCTQNTGIETSGLKISFLSLSRQTLISGPHVLAQIRKAYSTPVGWPEIVNTPTYALAVRRDRVLLVDGPEMTDGWHESQTQAVSDVTGAYTVFEITGPDAMSLLKRGTELALATPSRSVARLLFGFGTFLYRSKDAQTFRVHVSSAQSQALWKTLKFCATED